MKKIINIQEMAVRVLVIFAGLLIAVGVAQATTTVGTNTESVVTRATGETGSFQTIAGDLTYEGAAGGTSTYHAGVMGNFMGAALSNANATIHAGVVGKYSVTGSDAVTGPKAGIVGEAETSVANSAVMAVLGGDGGAITPGAAYGVRYMNSTGGAEFGYGLDLFSAAFGGYNAVTYGTADIRLQNGETISNETDGTVAIGGAGTTLGVGNAGIRTGTAVPTACSAGQIFIDTDADPTALFVCDANEDGDGEFDAVTISD